MQHCKEEYLVKKTQNASFYSPGRTEDSKANIEMY